MKTRRLFYEDVYQREFDAEVTGFGQDERGRYLELTQTVFYPEGGGQPADIGVLRIFDIVGPMAEIADDVEGTDSQDDNSGEHGERRYREIAVIDVQYVGSVIRHYIAEVDWEILNGNLDGSSQECADQCLNVACQEDEGNHQDIYSISDRNDQIDEESQTIIGHRVHGVIDWKRRFDLMQQHSGEHIVSGFIHEKYGYDNVGFHMGEDVITIDVNGLLDKEQLAELEQRANAYIWTNQYTHIFTPERQELKSITYRSKKELFGDVRLVEFPGSDLCACCGLHVTMTGEIGLVKLLSVKHFREGVRIEMVSGQRAFSLMNEHYLSNSQVAVALSVKPGETKEAVHKLQEENHSLKGQIMEMQREHFHMRARQCEGQSHVLVVEEHLEAADVRKETDSILDACQGMGIVISGNDQSGYKYAIGQRNGNVRDFVKEMNQALLGRGGGKPDFAQGSLKAAYTDIRAFFEEKSFTILL